MHQEVHLGIGVVKSEPSEDNLLNKTLEGEHSLDTEQHLYFIILVYRIITFYNANISKISLELQ